MTDNNNTSKDTLVKNKPESQEQYPVFQPAVDIQEEDSTFELNVEMPGVDDSSVEITVEKNRLTIHGTVDKPDYDGLTPLHTEYRIGDYERSFTISDDIDLDSIEATVRNGLLTVRMKRHQPAGPQKVAVKAG